jgi:hypothetical protein
LTKAKAKFDEYYSRLQTPKPLSAFWKKHFQDTGPGKPRKAFERQRLLMNCTIRVI